MAYKNFRMTDLVDEGARENDLDKIRRALANSCQFDHAFVKGNLKDGLEYVAKQHHINVFVAFDPSVNPLYGPRVDRHDPTLTREDFSSSLFYLTENFCRERIQDTEKLGRYLYPEEAAAPQQTKYSYKPERVRNENPPKASDNLVLLAIAGAAVLVVLWLILK